ncbi:MAG TPA: malectin domain-containing carbohydrate-binding protein, partial [Bacilli bacterium]
VDPYTFSYLLHQKLEGSPTANSIMLKVDVPDMMIAGEDYPVEVTVRNMGQWWWTKGEYDRLGSPSPNQFVWKNFADGGYSNNVTDQRAFLSDSDWIASMGIKKFKFTVQAPAATGNFTFAAQMIRDLYGYQGQLYSKTVQVIARPGNGAQIVSISAPDTAAEGASIPVTITMKNIGTNTWTAANNFKLGTFPKFLLATDLSAVNDYVWTNFSNGGDNSGGAQNQRAYLGSSESIATGQTKQFSFNITVPNQRGTYSLAARMVQELVAWFGDTAVKDIRVGPSSAVSLDAALVEGAVPIHLAPDETTEVAVTVKNVGTSTWTRSSNIVLASTSSNQVVWSNFRDGGSSTSVTDQKALLSTTDSIGSEQSKTFSFKIQAPSAQGNYTVSARMKTDGGAEFGDTYTWTIKVVGSKNAELASSKIPTTMTAGSTQRVKIEVRNTGTLNWYNSDMVRLGTHPALNNQFQFGGFYPNGGYSNSITDQRVFINPNIQILRGKPYDFDFSITAPTATGTYKLSVQMIHDGVAAFGPAMEWNIQVVSGYQKTINAGAATNFTDTYGQVWLADQAYSTSNGWGYTGTSSAVSTPNTITVYDDSNPDTQENNMNISQTARQGTSFEYKFDVSNGTYRVELSLAEFIKTADAQRKFSISAEGKRVVQDYDPYLLLGGANKGRDIALKEVTVSDGQLNLQFSSSIDQALINAIKVVRLR